MNIVLHKNRNDLVELFSGIGAEIGVAEAQYSKQILDNPAVSKLYGVDPFIPHKGYRDYTRNETFSRLYESTVKRMRDYSNFFLIQTYSMDAVKRFDDNSLDFVYIDADHSYATTLEDITEWTKKVKPGGVVAGDDYVRRKGQDQYYDVVTAVDDYVRDNNIPELFIYAEGKTPTNWMFYKS